MTSSIHSPSRPPVPCLQPLPEQPASDDILLLKNSVGWIHLMLQKGPYHDDETQDDIGLCTPVEQLLLQVLVFGAEVISPADLAVDLYPPTLPSSCDPRAYM